MDFNKFESEKIENLNKIIGGDGSTTTSSSTTDSSSSTSNTGGESSANWDLSVRCDRIEMK